MTIYMNVLTIDDRAMMQRTRQWRHPLMARCLWLLLMAVVVQCQEELTTTLSNGKEFPLLGMGVGNLQRDRIVDMMDAGAQVGLRLVDTSHASQNEALIKQAIDKQSKTGAVFHVVTKVWYTHLGYERTKLSVRESLNELVGDNSNHLRSSSNVKIHILLHWPRCRTDISWMDCEGEEERLPQTVKNAGPPPHLDKDHAYLESWRALEDLYEENSVIESIGVSNFNRKDLEKLMEYSRITPHILQGNVWEFSFDPYLVKYCKDHDIHFQAYNVMNGILSQASKAPNAYRSLLHVGQELGNVTTPAQVVLCWLMQQDVSVIPRTSSMDHLRQNAAANTCPTLTDKQRNVVNSAVGALLRGVDLNPPKATFVNSNQVVHLFWSHHHESGEEEVPVKEHLQPGETFNTDTYPGHVFVAYDESKVNRKEYQISAYYGDSEQFHIEL